MVLGVPEHLLRHREEQGERFAQLYGGVIDVSRLDRLERARLPGW